jgi:hypothetical protein
VLARAAAENKNSHVMNSLWRAMGLHAGGWSKGLFR